MHELNLLHLRAFWVVARAGSVTAGAGELRVAASALSTQIRALEEALGQPLFLRKGRRLVLTEAGHVAVEFAETVFAASEELVRTMRQRRRRPRVLRVGAVATLSRNFQRSFLRPVIAAGRPALRVVSGGHEELLGQLLRRELDVVLTNRAPPPEDDTFRARRLARQAVSLVHARPLPPLRIPEDLDGAKMILPAPGSELRSAFDALCARGRVRPKVLADVDDMAMMRLLAQDADALALVPSVVVRDELRRGLVHEVAIVDGVAEVFYAVTREGAFPIEPLEALLARDEEALLEAALPARPRRSR